MQRGSGSSVLSAPYVLCCALTGLTTDDTNLGGGSADKCGGGNPAGFSGFLTDFMHHGFVRVVHNQPNEERQASICLGQ